MQGYKKKTKKNLGLKKQDVLAQPSSSSYMFNPAPMYAEELEANKDEKLSHLKKRRTVERKKLEKKVELMEYMSSEEETAKPHKQQQLEDNEDQDYGALEYIDQDIVGYFGVKGPKIIAQSEKIQEPTFSPETLVVCCVSEIGPNGTYIVVNLNRNKKGFISLDNLRIGHLKSSSYSIGEYVLARVLQSNDSIARANKIQMTMMPASVNQGKEFKDVLIGSLLQGIPIEEGEYGYQITFFEEGKRVYKGFCKLGDQKLTVGRVYMFEAVSKDQKQRIIVVQRLLNSTLQDQNVIAKKLSLGQLEPTVVFTPGTLWGVNIVKELKGGLLVRIPKIGVLGWVFADYQGKYRNSDQKKVVNARLIGFDQKLKNFQFSLRTEHTQLTTHIQEVKQVAYNAFRLVEALYGGSFLVTPLLREEPQLTEVTTKKGKKSMKALEKGAELQIKEEGPLSFVHSSNLWTTETPDDKFAEVMQIGNIVDHGCRVREVNYLDHISMATTRPSQVNLEYLTINALQAGEFVTGNIKAILQSENNGPIRIVVVLSQGLQGMVPNQQIWDYDINGTLNPKIRVGAKLRARILKVDPKSNSVILSIKPTLMQKDIKVVKSLDQVNYSDQIYGYVSKQIPNGFIINFFGEVSGLLSLKEIEASGQQADEIHVGMTVKVYVKYVNVSPSYSISSIDITIYLYQTQFSKEQCSAQENKLLLSLRKIDAPEENEVVKSFKDEKQALTTQLESLQLQHLDADVNARCSGRMVNYKIRKQQPQENMLVLESLGKSGDNDMPKHFAVLLREQVTHSTDKQQNILTALREQNTIQCTMIPNNGVCLVSYKFKTTKSAKMQVGGQYMGYVVELNTRYALVTMPGVEGCPTGILNLDVTKTLAPIHYMQSVPVIVKNFDKNATGRSRVTLTLASDSNTTTCIQYFQDEQAHDVTMRVGDIVEATISLLKDYGAIAHVPGATGFIMKHNLNNVYKEGDKMQAQILDVDYNKKVIDLREVDGATKEPKLDKKLSGQVLLVKDAYSIIKLKSSNSVGFMWTPKGFYKEDNIQVGDIVKGLMCINREHMVDTKFNKINYVPIFIQMTEESVIQPKLKKEHQGTISSMEYNYIYVDLADGQKGRIHRSQFDLVDDLNCFFGVRSVPLKIGQEVQCKTLKVPHRFLKGRVLELTALTTKQLLMCGKTDLDLGKLITGVVRLVSSNSLVPVTLEAVGGYVIGLNGWDCNLVGQGDGALLNKLDAQVKVGDVVKVLLQADKKGKIIGVVQRGSEIPIEPVELYSKQIFRVLSSHGQFARVQLPNDNFASIDITALSDQWLPTVMNIQRGSWGSCRITQADDKHAFWGSCRSEYLDDRLWKKCLHPILSSQLSFQKLLKPNTAIFDVRSESYRNPAYAQTLASGTLLLGYVTSVTNAGAFVKYGSNNSCTLLVPNSEMSDEIEHKVQCGTPVLVLVTENKSGRCVGSMRFSLISKVWSQIAPKAGEVVEGVVVEVKNSRATLKLNGCLLQAEMDKRNAEGAEGEEGWWAERLVKVGAQMKAVVLSVKELPNGRRIVKVSNVEQLVEEKEKKQGIKAVGETNQDAVDVYESLLELSRQYQQEKKDVMEQEVVQEDGEVEEEEDGSIEEEKEEHQDEEIEEEEEEEQEEIEVKQKKSKKVKDQVVIEEIIDEETLQSRAQFERQILTQPNSSELWIKFVSFVMEKEGIESARSIMERALRVINFSNDSERLNLWTAYLNLEFHFGTEDRLIILFKQACNTCQPKQVYLRLIDIYTRAESWDLMVELARSLVSKFKQSLKTWKTWLQCLIQWHQKSQQRNKENNQAYSMKDNLQRAMQCLKAHKHPQLLAHYARLQFQSNQVESGRTTFDALLQKYPKRTDILGQYIDLSVKFCQADQTRSLLERALQFKLNPHKTKFIFKKWLEFEAQHGSPTDVEAIQKRAFDWVQAYKGRGTTNDDDDDLNDDDNEEDE